VPGSGTHPAGRAEHDAGVRDMVGEPRRSDEEWNRQARQETPEQRLDRNFGELLQELRVAETGVQILFAFLLTLAFTQWFEDLSGTQRGSTS
jgi:hypothetical protein